MSTMCYYLSIHGYIHIYIDCKKVEMNVIAFGKFSSVKSLPHPSLQGVPNISRATTTTYLVNLAFFRHKEF